MSHKKLLYPIFFCLLFAGGGFFVLQKIFFISQEKTQFSHENENTTITVLGDGEYTIEKEHNNFTVFDKENKKEKIIVNDLHGLDAPRDIAVKFSDTTDHIELHYNNREDQKKQVTVATEIVYVETLNPDGNHLPLEFNNAKLTLNKKNGTQNINAILTCADFDFDKENNTCKNWEIATDVKIVAQNDHDIQVQVQHFSAYVGVYLEIINIQSDLTAGDVWTTKFNTYGQDTLTIQAVDGTTYPEDIIFDGIYCGERKLTEDEFTFDDQVITVPDYTCDNEESRIENQAITSGRHWLAFSFGETQNIKSHNFACDSGTLADTCTVSTTQIMTNGDTIAGTGNIIIADGGNLSTANTEFFSIIMDEDVTIESGGTITGNLSTLISANLDIQTGGSINVNGRGYAAQSGPGAGVTYSTVGTGGGYGGDGGNYNSNTVAGVTYGSVTDPTDLGSGGGRTSGGAGGGAVKLDVSGTLTLNGVITANGNNGTGSYSNYSGGGSGGGIWINAGTLAGAGSLTANGGAGGVYSSSFGGSGGGGRISINYTTDSSTITSFAHSGSVNGRYGGAGTIYTKASAETNGDLLVDNNDLNGADTTQVAAINQTFDNITINGNAKYVIPADASLTSVNDLVGGGTGVMINNGSLLIPNTVISGFTKFTNNGTISGLPSSVTFSNITFYENGTLPLTDLTIGSGATFEFQDLNPTTPETLANLTILGGGLLTHQGNSTTQDNTLNLAVTNNLDIQTGGSINVNGRGYAAQSGPGAGVTYSTVGTGGGYGGDGGNYNSNTVAGVTYGSVTDPTDLGSGGGRTSGGAGGGAVKLDVSGTLTLNGVITANGNNGTGSYSNYSGGGSGGGIWINAGTLAGAGSLTANGGAGGVYSSSFGGSGGGGRISINYTTDSSTITSFAHSGSVNGRYGGAGTIYTKASAETNGDLLVDNNDLNGADTTQVAAINQTFDNITINGNAKYVIPADASLTSVNDLVGGGTGVMINNGSLLIPNTVISGFTKFTNNGTISGLPSSVTFSNITFYENGTLPLTDLTIGSGATFEFQDLNPTTPETLANLTILGGGLLTHQGNSTTQDNTLNLAVTNNLDIQTGGSINVNGRGYESANGPGAGIDAGGYGSGAGHRSKGGGIFGNANAGGSAYGDPDTPIDLGSGGGPDDGAGSTGGGAVKLNVNGILTVDGDITANAFNAGGIDAGGGSGGSIYLICGTLTGTGSLSANGGSAQEVNAGAGAPGRIKNSCTTDNATLTIAQDYGTIGVKPQTPTVTTSAATDITYNSATLNADLTSVGTDTDASRIIEWGTETGTYVHSCDAGTGTTGTYSCSVTNLDPETTYYARAKAENDIGITHGSEVTFTTEQLQDVTIPEPDESDMTEAVAEGYIMVDNGTIDNTTQVTTSVNITFQTANTEVLFPVNTVITESADQSFNFQSFVTTNIVEQVKAEQEDSRVAFKVGVPGEKLSFSQPVTVTAFVGGAFNDQTLDILYQNEGETTWNTQGTCTVENGTCTFTTNHATIYTINGTLQSTGDTPLNINTEVLDTLTMDCYESTNGSGTYDVLLGTVSNPGYVTAGTPAIGQSTCTVTTNDDQGYYLTVEDDNGISSTVLTHTDPNTGTLYEIQDLTHWNDTTLTTENWNPPTTKGLGFSVITFPDTDTANNIFDGIWNETGNCPEGTTSDSNDYAGIPDTPETIAAVPQYTANHTTTNICYKVDVPASQPSGTYTGSVTYTATSDASSYLN
jgi:hypothetical protein